ncbi:hypothetical protein RvY_15431 [Ramazzottius varieornatus]|uniref:Uncharacterized protein n=1 Tax=Ramazzottius varieornatus TaxID=947166 RepID=A0A1D1VWH6_RAMVA|nr:hypothetical protein RvY_15431 [Ramazzottius varieornatus]
MARDSASWETSSGQSQEKRCEGRSCDRRGRMEAGGAEDSLDGIAGSGSRSAAKKSSLRKIWEIGYRMLMLERLLLCILRMLCLLCLGSLLSLLVRVRSVCRIPPITSIATPIGSIPSAAVHDVPAQLSPRLSVLVFPVDRLEDTKRK